jgi:hypothetical protein
MVTWSGAPIRAPPRKTHAIVPTALVHSQEPTFRMRHVLTKGSSGFRSVPSGMVTSVIKAASRQLSSTVGVGVGVCVGVAVGGCVGVAVGGTVSVAVAVGVGVGASVAVAVAVGGAGWVAVGVGDGASVAVAVAAGSTTEVAVGVGVGVACRSFAQAAMASTRMMSSAVRIKPPLVRMVVPLLFSLTG